MDKFEVGKRYYSWEVRYASNGTDLIDKKMYWLCVKRNESTGYVSFRRYFKGKLMSTQYPRKVEYEWDFGKKVCEKVKIGYGGSGGWRNWFHLRADQTE